MFRLKDTRLPRQKRSPDQIKAQERNFKIFRLRSLHENAWLLSPPNRQAMIDAIDAELISMGAATREEHYERKAKDDEANMDKIKSEQGPVF